MFYLHYICFKLVLSPEVLKSHSAEDALANGPDQNPTLNSTFLIKTKTKHQGMKAQPLFCPLRMEIKNAQTVNTQSE